MSADNWRECPKCSEKRRSAVEAVKALYGKIPLSDYEVRMKDAHEVDAKAREETLREDYEFYYEEPFMLTVSYGCSCKDCGFSWSMNQKFDTRKNSAARR